MREESICDQNFFARFQGHRILVLGCESEVKEYLTEELRRMGLQVEQRSEVSEQSDISPEDYVILMGTIADFRKKPQRRGTEKYPWIREEKEQGAHLKSWTEFGALTNALQSIRKTKPTATVFVSDSSVYGKLFDEPHLIREDEIGYLCHTDEDLQDGQVLRMTEHLCSRLAREDGINIRIARLQRSFQSAEDAANNVSDMTETLLRVLLLGTPGEPYNISGPWQVSQDMEEISPLSPNKIVEDLAKAKSL